MKLYLILILLVIVIMLTRREPFTESFGLSGYTKPTGFIQLDDPRPDLTGYSQAEAKVNNDLMQEFVLLANKEIEKRTGLCTYIIETTKVTMYSGVGKNIYECMFMAVKNSGFAYGVSVVASFEVKDSNVQLISLRTQPLGVQTPVDVSPYTEGASGKEFIDYRLVKETAVPKLSELENAKIKLQ